MGKPSFEVNAIHASWYELLRTQKLSNASSKPTRHTARSDVRELCN